ncbi:MAG: GntR family transcriptional regulator, partial [Paraclostridium sp.]
MEKYKVNITKECPKYLQIYNHIKNLIIDGVIEKNEKLPPIRKIANVLKVNNTTIVKAYELLDKENYIYKNIGSGTFAADISKSNNNKIAIDGLIRFDNGNPSMDMFPIEDFKNAINIALEKEGAHIFEYDDG